MPSSVLIELEIPTDLEQFRLPAGVQQRLQDLLDRQDHGTALTPAERQEAEGSGKISLSCCRCCVRVDSGAVTSKNRSDYAICDEREKGEKR